LAKVEGFKKKAKGELTRKVVDSLSGSTRRRLQKYCVELGREEKSNLAGNLWGIKWEGGQTSLGRSI